MKNAKSKAYKVTDKYDMFYIFKNSKNISKKKKRTLYKSLFDGLNKINITLSSKVSNGAYGVVYNIKNSNKLIKLTYDKYEYNKVNYIIRNNVTHKNLVKYYKTFEIEKLGIYCIIMEKLDLSSIHIYIRNKCVYDLMDDYRKDRDILKKYLYEKYDLWMSSDDHQHNVGQRNDDFVFFDIF